MKKLLFLILALVLITSLWNISRAESLNEDNLGREIVKVNRVISGDTIEVTKDGAIEKVRLIGIMCPDTKPGRKVEAQKKATGLDSDLIITKGISAKRYLSSILYPGRTIGLEYDIDGRDRYGTTVAYVWNGEALTNRDIVLKGYCWSFRNPPNIKYQGYISGGRDSPFHTNRIVMEY